MLVEDDERVSESTRRLLELEGLQVDCAFDGEAGLVMAQSHLFDVIVLDRRLPKLSGDDVLERLRSGGSSTPVLMLTAYPDYDSAHRSGALGASRYLLKSMMIGAALAAAIRAAAAGTMMPPKASRLFPAYGGKTSRAFSDLVNYVRGDEVNSTDLPRRLVRTISAHDLTFAEFVAAAKSLSFLNRKAHLPLDAALSTLRDWLDPSSTARPLDSRLQEVLAELEEAGPTWPKLRAADVRIDSYRDRQLDTELFDSPPNPTFPYCRKAVVMRRAVLQLLGPHEQIRQIAYGLGYSDHGNFDHEFLWFFGIAPKQFRWLA